eukprot:3546735-Pleurochrysis_carterae.AAC.1
MHRVYARFSSVTIDHCEALFQVLAVAPEQFPVVFFSAATNPIQCSHNRLKKLFRAASGKV